MMWLENRRLAPGAIVASRFEIESVAGSGGMGTVYRALDRHTGRIIALKVLNESVRRLKDRFANEVQVLSELRHPGIVSYVTHGRTGNGQFFLAMEWLEGEDLMQRLTHTELSPIDIVTLACYIAEALAVAHRLGIVHRDIKPSNLFLRDGQIERVTLLDFGIARSSFSTKHLSRTGEIVGTAEYLPPERIRGQRELRPSADVFSLGCVLYECLTGQPPFSARSIPALLAKILYDDPAPVRSLRPFVSPGLEALLMRMMAKDPAHRPRDAKALLAELAALQ